MDESIVTSHERGDYRFLITMRKAFQNTAIRVKVEWSAPHGELVMHGSARNLTEIVEVANALIDKHLPAIAILNEMEHSGEQDLPF